MRNIMAERGLTAVLCSLQDLHDRTRRLLTSEGLSLDYAKVIASRVAEVRMLLTELVSLTGGAAADSGTSRLVGELREQYRNLEGAVKEARNILARKGGRGV